MSACPAFERGPDEEGIETLIGWKNSITFLFERGPDEEGIETRCRSAAFCCRGV